MKLYLSATTYKHNRRINKHFTSSLF